MTVFHYMISVQYMTMLIFSWHLGRKRVRERERERESLDCISIEKHITDNVTQYNWLYQKYILS